MIHRFLYQLRPLTFTSLFKTKTWQPCLNLTLPHPSANISILLMFSCPNFVLVPTPSFPFLPLFFPSYLFSSILLSCLPPSLPIIDLIQGFDHLFCLRQCNLLLYGVPVFSLAYISLSEPCKNSSSTWSCSDPSKTNLVLSLYRLHLLCDSTHFTGWRPVSLVWQQRLLSKFLTSHFTL